MENRECSRLEGLKKGQAMSCEPLPLFPLHTVLFPQMPLPLHIFEERYKRMIQQCIADQRTFGVVLIREGSDTGSPAIPQTIGTCARIHRVEQLPEGRMNILTVGTDRFRLLDYATEAEPYLIGIIEHIGDVPADPAVVQPLATDVAELFHSYFHELVAHAGVEMPSYELPDSPEQLSFVIAAAMQIELSRRQAFLEMTSTTARLTAQKSLLEQELERIRSFTHMDVSEGESFDATQWRQFFSRN